MPFEANNTMIYIRNITIRTAKSAPYLGNVGLKVLKDLLGGPLAPRLT